MTVEASITSSLGATAARIERAYTRETVQAYLRASEIVAGNIRREVSAWTSRTSTRKTGALGRSFVPVIRRSDEHGIEGGVYSAVVYARIHEEGGTIKPKGRALTIPITPEARRRRARDWPELFIVKRAGHLPILATKQGKNGIKPQYILKSSVRITAKNYIAKAAARSQPEVEKLIADAVIRLLRSDR